MADQNKKAVELLDPLTSLDELETEAGDLSLALDEEPQLSDLSWLQVDEEAYRESESLPKQNLDAVPELVEQWHGLKDAQKFRLAPDAHQEGRDPTARRTPFWSERNLPGELTGEDAARLVELFARNKVQAGVTGDSLVAALRKNFDKSLLKKASSKLKDVFAEQGLLGAVYVDAKLFPDCYKGKPEKSLTARNRQAKFVQGKSKCGDCIHNREGRCAIFQKEIVFDVNYSEGLWQEYKERAEAEGRDLSDVESAQSYRQRIQTANMAPKKEAHKALDGKPVVKDPASKISSAAADAWLKIKNVERAVVENEALRDKICAAAQRMMRGDHSPEMQDRVANDADLSILRKELHLLGNLHLDLSYFPTYREAAQFMVDLEDRPPITVGKPYREENLDTRIAQSRKLDITAKKTLIPVVNRYMLNKRGHQLRVDDKELSLRIFDRLSKASAPQVRKIAQAVYSQPLSEKARQYEAKMIFDPTQGITSEEADKRLREATSKRDRVLNPRAVENAREVVSLMLKGEHDKRVATLLREDDNLKGLKPHMYLLGNLYVDTSITNPKMVEAAASMNPVVKRLPVLTPNNRDRFFEKPEVHARIADRIAAVKGEESTVSFKRRVLAMLDGQDSGTVRELARRVFSMPERTASVNAPTGQTVLDEFELQGDPTAIEGFDLTPERQTGPDVQFGEFFIE